MDREGERLRLATLEKLVEFNFGKYEITSFAIFAILNIAAMIVEGKFFGFYIVLLAVDLVATLLDSGTTIQFDRGIFVLLFIVLGSFSGQFGALQSMTAVLAVVTTIDFTIFLRKLEDTKVSNRVILKRLQSCLYTIVPTFLISYAVIYLYSQITITGRLSVFVIGMGSVVAFLIIYFLVQNIANPKARVVNTSKFRSLAKSKE
jgi:hypothetical protein